MKNLRVMIKVSLFATFSIAVAWAGTGQDVSQPRYEKLGEQKGRSFHFDPGDIERSKAVRARKFAEDLANSDPETQKAILKSMKKFSSNPSDYRDFDELVKRQVDHGGDMVRLLKQVSLAPTGRTLGGRTLMKVTKVEAGSVYDKAGVSVGDIVRSGKAVVGATNDTKSEMKIVATRTPAKTEKLKFRQKLIRNPAKKRPSRGAYSTLDFKGQTLQRRELAIYKDFDLKVGDRIIMFNGMPLSSPQKAMSLYQGVKRNTVTKLLVQRGDTFKLLTKTR